MKRFGYMASILALLLLSHSAANADIIGGSYGNDGDGAINCVGTMSEPTQGEYALAITGTQFWGPGHVGSLTYVNGVPTLSDTAFFDTNSPTDPTITVHNIVTNDSGFDWGSYHINVYQNNPFTLSAPFVNNSGWTASLTMPTAVSIGGGVYEGQIDYTGGPAVPADDVSTLDFGYKLAFSGATHYQYTQEMIPGAVPEAGTLALLACGLFGALVAQRRRR